MVASLTYHNLHLLESMMAVVLTLTRPLHRVQTLAQPLRSTLLYSHGRTGRVTQRPAPSPMRPPKLPCNSLQPRRGVPLRMTREATLQAGTLRNRRRTLGPPTRNHLQRLVRHRGGLRSKGGAALPTSRPKGVAGKESPVVARQPGEVLPPAMGRRQLPIPRQPATLVQRGGGSAVADAAKEGTLALTAGGVAAATPGAPASPAHHCGAMSARGCWELRS